jgi:drug/metabolite transporter (DMT)-like permease
MTTSTAVFFAKFRSRPGQRRPWSPWIWTTLGGLAIPLWATWPALALHTHAIPALECLTIVFLVAWAAASPLERAVLPAESEPSTWRWWIPAAAFGFAEVGSAGFFLLAIRRVAAAEANLIVYLWPGIVVFLGAALGIFHLRFRHIAGIVLGFVGAATLIGVDELSASFVGIGLALLASLSWALYCVLRLKWRGATGPLLTRGFGIAALLCAGLHFLLEPTVLPVLGGAAAAIAVGVVPTAIANVAWDEGFRQGDSQLLTVMAYGTPLCSALLLTALGVEPLTWRLAVGAIAIVVAGVMSRADAEEKT